MRRTDSSRIGSPALPSVRDRTTRRGTRWRIGVAAYARGRPRDLPGTTVVDRKHDRLVLDVDATTDVDDVLMAARAAGSVTMFQVGSRSLAERFRKVVDQ